MRHPGCCSCACGHAHTDTGVIPQDSCVMCKWCHCIGEDMPPMYWPDDGPTAEDAEWIRNTLGWGE